MSSLDLQQHVWIPLAAALTNATDPISSSSSSSSSSTGSSSSESSSGNSMTTGDYFRTWGAFLVIAVASSRLGTIFPRIGLPLITGYMIVGVLSGPYVLGLVEKSNLNALSFITQLALSFIAFSAGSELYLPELRSLFRIIISITTFNALFTYIICSIFIIVLATSGIIKWTSELSSGCVIGIGLIAASIMVARSPASAIAVVRELRAKGPVTSTMLGVTVVGDVVVLILFTLSTSISLAQCSGNGFEGGEFLLTILSLIVAVGIGYLLGGILIFLLWVPYIPAKYTIIPLGFAIYRTCDWFAVWSIDNIGVAINFDALLICITAGYVVTNQSRNRIAFLKLLGSAASYIFIPFFTKVGVELNLTVLVESIPFALLVFTMRAICIFLGSSTGGHVCGLDRKQKLFMWMTMLAQAGVSLGLASEIAVKFEDWGRNFQTSIIAVVLINQFMGPVLCKYALKTVFEEAGKMKEGEDPHGSDDHYDGDAKGESGDADGDGKVAVPKTLYTLIIGIDGTTLALAQRLLDQKTRLVLADARKRSLGMTSSLRVTTLTSVTSGPGNLLQAHTSSSMSALITGSVGSSHVEEEDDDDDDNDDSEDAQRNDGGASRTVDIIEDELGGAHTRTASSSSPQHHRRARSTAAQLQQQRMLVLPLSNLADVPLQTRVAQLIESVTNAVPGAEITAAFVRLSSDEATYVASSTLLDKFHVAKVVAGLHHPSWSDVFAAHGIVPLVDFSSSVHMMERALCDQGELDLVNVSALRAKSITPSVLAAFRSVVHVDEDLTNSLLGMVGDQRYDFENRHKPPSAQFMSGLSSADATLAGMANAMLQSNVKLLATVPESMRDDYVQHVQASLMHEDSTDAREDFDNATEVFLGPSGLDRYEKEKRRTNAENE